MKINLFSFLMIFLKIASAWDYSDYEARYFFWPSAAAASHPQPEHCLDNIFTNYTMIGRYETPCNMLNATLYPITFPLNNITCVAILFVAHSNQSIVVSFKGSTKGPQIIEEALTAWSMVYYHQQKAGKLHQYFFFAEEMLYVNTSLGLDFRNTVQKYNTYDIWVTGHSLGGSLSSIFAAKRGLDSIGNVVSYKTMTFGQPRTGDYLYAAEFDNQYGEAYRVINKADIVPHTPVPLPFLPYQHHHREVWYPVTMATPSYNICTIADESTSCSNALENRFPQVLNVFDHVEYFNVNLARFISNNCSYDGIPTVTPLLLEDTQQQMDNGIQSMDDNDVNTKTLAANSSLGFDSIIAIGISTFQCLAQNGYSHFIGRIGSNDGSIDNVGIQNLVNARQAGFPKVQAYIFPCTSSETCAGEQANKAAITLYELNAVVDTVWIDIEEGQWWTNDHMINQQLIQTIANELGDGLDEGCYASNFVSKLCNTTLGIYTTEAAFNSIMGPNNTHFENGTLWWVNYDGVQNFSNFKPFGGWTKPTIHKYSTNVNGPCGVTMDQNWMG